MKSKGNRPPRALYRIEQRQGRWMFVAPDGSPFVSLGVVHTAVIPGFRDPAEAARVELATQVAMQLNQWGFNTAGCHHPPELRDRMPFIADTYTAWIPYFEPKPRYPEVFSGYSSAVRHAIHDLCAPVKSNPNLIGYYWTDTPRWDLDTARRLVNDDWVSAIRRNPGIYAGKRRYVEFLRERHSANPEAFRKIYGMDLDSPAMLDADFARYIATTTIFCVSSRASITAGLDKRWSVRTASTWCSAIATCLPTSRPKCSRKLYPGLTSSRFSRTN
jgi:hypothetical protein